MIFERMAQLGETKANDASYKVFQRQLANPHKGLIRAPGTATEVLYIIKFRSAHNDLKR